LSDKAKRNTVHPRFKDLGPARVRHQFFAQPDLDPNSLKIAAPSLSPGQSGDDAGR
jgi:hypothetical protein